MPGFKQPIIDLLGPRLITAFFMCIMTGIIINQSIQFWNSSHTERLAIRILVAWATILAFFHTCVIMWDAWQIFIVNFGNFFTANPPTWASRSGSLMAMLISVPVQSFFTWRCWKVTNNRFVLVSLPLLCIGYFIVGIAATVYNMRLNFNLSPEQLANIQPVSFKPNGFVMAGLVIPATLDISISTIMLVFLWSSKPEQASRQFQRIIQRVNLLIWQSALPPCASALISLITYLTLPYTFWTLLFQTTLGHLYVISLFVSLNGLKDVKNHRMGMNASGSSAIEGNEKNPQTVSMNTSLWAPTSEIDIGSTTSAPSYTSHNTGTSHSRHYSSILEVQTQSQNFNVPTGAPVRASATRFALPQPASSHPSSVIKLAIPSSELPNN